MTTTKHRMLGIGDHRVPTDRQPAGDTVISRPGVDGAISHPVTGPQRAPGGSEPPDARPLAGRPGPAPQPLTANTRPLPANPDDLV